MQVMFYMVDGHPAVVMIPENVEEVRSLLESQESH